MTVLLWTQFESCLGVLDILWCQHDLRLMSVPVSSGFGFTCATFCTTADLFVSMHELLHMSDEVTK